jgi:hypothetical protein
MTTSAGSTARPNATSPKPRCDQGAWQNTVSCPTPGGLRSGHSSPALRTTPAVARPRRVSAPPPGGYDWPQIMRAQLDKLAAAAQQPNITLQVLPFTSGLDPAMYGPFRVFQFASSDQPDIAYGESMTSA